MACFAESAPPVAPSFQALAPPPRPHPSLGYVHTAVSSFPGFRAEELVACQEARQLSTGSCGWRLRKFTGLQGPRLEGLGPSLWLDSHKQGLRPCPQQARWVKGHCMRPLSEGQATPTRDVLPPAGPPFPGGRGSSKGHGAGGHGKGQPSIRLALAASADLGGLVKDKAWLPQPRGAPLAQQCPLLPRETCLTFFV